MQSIMVNGDSLKLLTESLESYKRIPSLLKTDMNEVLTEIMKEYSALSSVKISDAVMNSLQQTMSSHIKIDVSCLGKLTFPNLTGNIMELFSESFKTSAHIDVSESVKAIAMSMNMIAKRIDTEHLQQLYAMDYPAMFANAFSEASSILDVAETAYSVVQDEIGGECDEDTSFTKIEVKESLNEQINNPKGFQARAADWTAKKVAKYFIIWQIICFVYANFFQPYFQEKIGVPVMTYVVSNVKELPEKGAKIIGQIRENIEAVIIENTNYYYKVTFIDENGERKEGYVAKRNLKVIEEKRVSDEKDNDLDTE